MIIDRIIAYQRAIRRTDLVIIAIHVEVTAVVPKCLDEGSSPVRFAIKVNIVLVVIEGDTVEAPSIDFGLAWPGKRIIGDAKASAATVEAFLYFVLVDTRTPNILWRGLLFAL